MVLYPLHPLTSQKSTLHFETQGHPAEEPNVQTEFPPFGLLIPLQESEPQLTGFDGQSFVQRQSANTLVVHMPCASRGLDVPIQAESLHDDTCAGQVF